MRRLIVCPAKQSQRMSMLLMFYLNTSDFINFPYVKKKIYLYLTVTGSKF